MDINYLWNKKELPDRFNFPNEGKILNFPLPFIRLVS